MRYDVGVPLTECEDGVGVGMGIVTSKRITRDRKNRVSQRKCISLGSSRTECGFLSSSPYLPKGGHGASCGFLYLASQQRTCLSLLVPEVMCMQTK